MEIDDSVKRDYPRRRQDRSAGGVAYRLCPNGDVEIALIATRRGTRWQLPKGTCEAGETAEQTAVREVQEEVGLTTIVEVYLRPIEYWYWDTYRKDMPELVQKRVDFYLLRIIGGELCSDSCEVDSAAWFRLHDAARVLTFPGEQAVVRDALAKLAG